MNISTRTKLNNGVTMPYLGLGVWRMKDGEETFNAVTHALKSGYRLIDTAQYYGNEASVGKAVLVSGIPREEVFVTSKLQISNFGYDEAIKTYHNSLQASGLTYFDLFLLHFPVNGLRLESWKALETLYKEGKCKAIGVSNFTIAHLTELMEHSETDPAVNQVEFSPFLYQRELLEFCQKHHIQLEAYAPLVKASLMDNPVLVEMAHKYGKTPAQILIRWPLQHDVIVIPKSSNPKRIEENADVFDFEINAKDMKTLDGLNQDLRTSWNPEDEIQVKSFSSYAVRKATLVIKKLRSL